MSTEQRHQVLNHCDFGVQAGGLRYVAKSRVLIGNPVPCRDLSLQNRCNLLFAQASARHLSCRGGHAPGFFQRDGACIVDRSHHAPQCTYRLAIPIGEGQSQLFRQPGAKVIRRIMH